MLEKIKKEYLIENVIDEINNISIFNLYDDIELIISDLIFEFENDDLDVDEFDIVELFDLKTLITTYLKNELFDENNEINFKYYDDVINLINQYNNTIEIFINDVDEIKYIYDLELNINKFHEFKNSNDLIKHNLSYDYYNTIDYYELNDIFDENDIDEIIDEILNELI